MKINRYNVVNIFYEKLLQLSYPGKPTNTLVAVTFAHIENDKATKGGQQKQFLNGPAYGGGLERVDHLKSAMSWLKPFILGGRLLRARVAADQTLPAPKGSQAPFSPTNFNDQPNRECG